MLPDINDAAEAPPKQKNRRVPVLLTLLLLFGLLLRVWGLGWSLPNARHPLATYHPDELLNLGAAQRVDIPHGKFDVGFYNYGAFYFYLVSFAHTFGRGYGLIPKTQPWPEEKPPLPPSEELARYAPEQAGLFLSGRWVTVLLGTATIGVVFALGRRLFGKKTGLAAALLYALAPLAVVHAHFLTVDVPVTFFVTLALLWSARLLEGGRWKDTLLAGVWVGLAAATKYNTGLVLIAPLAALFLSRRSAAEKENPPLNAEESPAPLPNKRNVNRDRLFKAAALLGITLLTFLIACPGPLLNWEAFQRDMNYELFTHSRTGHGYLFVETGPGWWYHLVISLPFGLGIPLFLLALAGVVWSLRRRTPQDILLLTFLLIAYLLTGLSAVRFSRYLLPLYPALFVLAARLIMETSERLIVTRLRYGIGALVLLLTGMTTFSLVRAMTLPDPRDSAADYLDKNAPQGASIAFAKIPWFFSPPLSPRFGAPSPFERRKAASEVTRFQLRIPSGDWDTGVLTPPPDYLILSNIETMHELDRLHIAPAAQFMQSIPPDYNRMEFAHAPVFGLPGGSILPDDLLYILPRLTLYQKS